jgi:hypothetical protein
VGYVINTAALLLQRGAARRMGDTPAGAPQ